MQKWFPNVNENSHPICHRVFNNPPSDKICSHCPTFQTLRDGGIHETVTRTPFEQEVRVFRVISSPIKNETGDIVAAIEMVEDMTEGQRAADEKQKLEQRLQQANKLEAVGSLASGIAHEINTPIQFVGDNTRYLSDCFDALLKLITKHQELWLRVKQGESADSLNEQWHQIEEEADLEYAATEVPTAITQTLDGVKRVAQIVRSMKEFAHSDQKETSACDLNRMLETTLTVARNELKYVADVVTDFDPSLPEINCHRDELNQVFLNLLINAAHTIADVVGDGGSGKGTITVRTQTKGDEVVVSITDTGTGIPNAIKDRIFDPFFTTKKVGKGTGQGLAIAHAVVAEKHRGSLTLETEVGKGTTFYVSLPLDQAKQAASEADKAIIDGGNTLADNQAEVEA
jgi:signal transduction histidine kinase